MASADWAARHDFVFTKCHIHTVCAMGTFFRRSYILRFSVLSSVITLSWFLAAHVLEYTSINTCRQTSPHLWWLVFGMLCIMYLMVFEIFIIGFILLVITPIVFVSCVAHGSFRIDTSSRFSGTLSLYVWAVIRYRIRTSSNQISGRFPKYSSKKFLL